MDDNKSAPTVQVLLKVLIEGRDELTLKEMEELKRIEFRGG